MSKKEVEKSAIQELHFANLQIQHLYNTLDEIETVGDTLVKAIAKTTAKKS